eukprot:TRINITY_DN39994_c0_g1_i1.p1 TRINITY_DN39994_c0_g1~~TRINITY_DN39994_c0_g1_i1.p1  ORF type:complete len:310 (+),score=67.88 TRINITY_DN39994_c0_g1_i1:45-932(+)
MAWQPFDDPANAPELQEPPSELPQIDFAPEDTTHDDEASALAALSGPMGSTLLQEGSPESIRAWLLAAEAQGLPQEEVEPVRQRLKELEAEAKAAKIIKEKQKIRLKASPSLDRESEKLLKQAWELRDSGNRCKNAKDISQAIRYYEWALDLLQPLRADHAGPTRCALLISLARCHLSGQDGQPDAGRAMRCCQESLQQGISGQDEAKELLEKAKALLGAEDRHDQQVSAKAASASAKRVEASRGTAGQVASSGRTVYCLELNSVQTFNMLDTVLTDDIFFAMDAIKQDRMRRSG